MTLDEAIEHAKTVSLENRKSGCYDCADLHKQLELWLTELKERRCNNVANGKHDGCDGCVFEELDSWDYPCNKCKQNYMDCWRLKR